MSARASGAVFERYPREAPQKEWTLALALADNAWDDGTHVFPSVSHMAWKSRQSVRSVQTHLAAMVARGWLQVVNRGGGRGRPTEYRINPEWLNGADLAPFSAAPVGPVDKSEKGATAAPFSPEKRVQLRTQKGATFEPTNRTEGTKKNPPTPQGGAASVENEQPAPDGERLAGFEAFEALYPSRAGMRAARRAWAREELGSEAEAIMRGLRAWIDSAEWKRRRAEGLELPGAAKWLGDRRWLDAPGLQDGAAPAPIVVQPVASAPPAPMPSDVRERLNVLRGDFARKRFAG